MKKIFLSFIIVILSFVFSGCDNKESYILFNKHPFTQDTILNTTNIFAPNERIYYLVTLPKPVESKRLLVQVFKMGSNERLGYELAWGKQVKIRDEQYHYFTDYFVLNSTGAYRMTVYSKDSPTKPLCSTEFHIKR